MDPQLQPYFTAVEQSKTDVSNKTLALANAQTALASAQSLVTQAQTDLDAAKIQNQKDGENLVQAVKTIYGVA